MKDRKYCEKHIGHTVHPKYGKCFLCRMEDGDLVECKNCGSNYHEPKYASCYQCAIENK